MEAGAPPDPAEIARVRIERGWFLYRSGRQAQALEEVAAALAADPRSARAMGLRAFCLLTLEKGKEAVEAARQTVALAPEWGWAHYVLGRILRLEGLPGEAETVLREAVRLEPEDPDHRLELAWLHFGRNLYALALDFAREGRRLDPGHPGCAAMEGLALQYLSRHEEAEAAYREALRLKPDLALAHAGMGHLALRRNEGKRSADSFGAALRADPGYGWASSGLPEALRLQFPGYGRIYAVVKALRGMREWKRMTIAVGLLLLFLCGGILGAVRVSGERGFSLGFIPFLGAPAIAYLWVFVVWVLRPLYELALRYHPVGRWLVDPGRLRVSRVLAAMLSAALLLFLVGALAGSGRTILTGLLLLGWLPPVGALLREPPPGNKVRESLFLGVLILLGVASGFLPDAASWMAFMFAGAVLSWWLLACFVLSFIST